MLKELLAELRDGSPTGRSQLAHTLGVSPDLIDQMLEDLAQRGYVTKSGTGDCEGGCGPCPHCAGTPTRAVAVWTLTEKGRRSGQKAAPEG